MAACPIIFWELGTRDPERLGAFYAQLFGWEVKDDKGYQTVYTGSIDGGIYASRDVMTLRPVLHIMVDDVAAYVQKALGLGAQVLTSTPPAGETGSPVLLRDPAGNLVGLIESSKWQSADSESQPKPENAPA